ncbi:MAG: hypothetical protein IJS01_01725 [Lentisphaeria bacterium]|nr:hypothetical protein [Lentisphaeria bacterium]
MNTWMAPADPPEETYIAVFRCLFSAAEALELKFDFSADNRAQLYLDGRRIADGPERGAPERWYAACVSQNVPAGEHVLTARVMCLDPEIRRRRCAYAQMTVRRGFFIDDASGLLSDWMCQIETGCRFETPFPDWGSFPRVHVESGHNHGILEGRGGVWEKPVFFTDPRPLHLPDLPAMRYEKTVPVKKTEELFYFPEYVCAWQVIRLSGRGTVEIRWAETPYLTPEIDRKNLKGMKGKRDGKYFIAEPDVFEVDGSFTWHDYWWHAGHYVQIKTEGNVRCDIEFFRTGYPYPETAPRSQLEKMALETLRACSFETYMDCPYYEQLMYIGDSRLEARCTYLLTGDHRLPAKALRMLSLSQTPEGALNAQYPSCSDQKIPSFMTIWLLMLSDYFALHGNDALVEELRPRAEKLLAYLEKHTTGGLPDVPGWGFVDWCENWAHGTPPGGTINSVISLFYLLALQKTAEMDLAPGLEEKAKALARTIRSTFYDKEKRLYALDPGKQYFSEHPQVLALLALGDTSVIPGLESADLTPCSIYFSSYYLEACRLFGLDDLLEKRLDRWRALENEGLTTFPEEFRNPRSDCHAWSSHILSVLPEKP